MLGPKIRRRVIEKDVRHRPLASSTCARAHTLAHMCTHVNEYIHQEQGFSWAHDSGGVLFQQQGIGPRESPLGYIRQGQTGSCISVMETQF